MTNRNDDVRYIPILRDHLEPIDRIAIAYYIRQQNRSILLDPT